jgi:hypothetical protein
MGIPSDVTGARDQSLSRAWSSALHQHPCAIDGIVWASRLHGGRCCAVYDRSLAKLHVQDARPILRFEHELASVIRRYALALVP